MEKLTKKRDINALAFLLAMTYMVSYLTRINYGAIISEIERETQIARSLLSMAVTGSFVTYGVGQIISGIIGDRVSPKKLVTCGFVVTVLMNGLMSFCRDPYQMCIIWCINGFAQSFMWPPLVRLMATLLTENDYKLVTAKMSWGSSIGTIIVYLLSPVLISGFGWRSVFLFCGLCGLVMIFVWNRFAPEIGPEEKVEKQVPAEEKKGVLFTPLLVTVMVSIGLQGMLRDGVTTWMPSYISETYQLSSVISILTGVILPVFSILSFQISARLYVKKFKNPLACAAVFFGTGCVAALALVFLSGKIAAISVLFSALLTGCMHGVNLMLVSMLPPFFKDSGKVSTMSGVLNSSTSVGSAVSTYGIALLSESNGWQFTLIVWFAIAALGTLLCVLCVGPWRKRFMKADA